jgi:hypothetical protein
VRKRGSIQKKTDPAPAHRAPSHKPITLCDALDRVLTTGVAARGEVAISVAGVDLVYLDARVLLASIDTAAKAGAALAVEVKRKER